MYFHYKDSQYIRYEEPPRVFKISDGLSIDGFDLLTDEQRIAYSFYLGKEVIPEYDSNLQDLQGPVCSIQDNKVIAIWTVINKTPEEIQAIRDGWVAELWQVAHDYEYEQISGSAIGLLAIGVLQGLPKSTAIAGWIKAIWSLYYYRKALALSGTPPDLDWSSCGAIPFTVPELMQEIGM